MSCNICGRVNASGVLKGQVVDARVSLHSQTPCTDENVVQFTSTDEQGKFEFRDVEEGTYHFNYSAFGVTATANRVVDCDKQEWVGLTLPVELTITLKPFTGPGETTEQCSHAIADRRCLVVAEFGQKADTYEFSALPDGAVLQTYKNEAEVVFAEAGVKIIGVKAYGAKASPDSNDPAYVMAVMQTHASEGDGEMIGGHIGVRLDRTRVHPTRDQALWIAIRNRTHAIGFTRYSHFINRVLQTEERERVDDPKLEPKLKELGTNLHGVGAYDVLKVATEAFLLLECGIRIEEDRDSNRRFFHPEVESARIGEPVSFEYAKAKLKEYLGSPPQLPYITRVVEAAFPEWRAGAITKDRVLTGGINEPCLIEHIWSYWHEEGMLVQTMNAVTGRFQNVHGSGDHDPIAHLEIDPLRPMNNLIWGVIQDEIRRLSVKRRAYEYEHQYGLTLYGKDVPELRPADSRSKFLEGFHNLLHLCSVFFKEDNDTTVIADGNPLLNALKEVHLLLPQGAHNQFGDLPWTARAEMMIQQWMLARPELRDFLQSRAMVPYKEAWMPQVDTMKTLQGWSDVPVTHFRDLAVYGEQILLSVRYGDWIALTNEDSAKNWARYWRPEIQGYLHAYRAATGVDLTNADTVDSTVPAILLQRRLATQQQRSR